MLSSAKTDVAGLEFFRLPGVSFSVGLRTYTRFPFKSVRDRSRVIGVLMPTPLSASSSLKDMTLQSRQML
jgi:hypothetical protein